MGGEHLYCSSVDILYASSIQNMHMEIKKVRLGYLSQQIIKIKEYFFLIGKISAQQICKLSKAVLGIVGAMATSGPPHTFSTWD